MASFIWLRTLFSSDHHLDLGGDSILLISFHQLKSRGSAALLWLHTSTNKARPFFEQRQFIPNHPIHGLLFIYNQKYNLEQLLQKLLLELIFKKCLIISIWPNIQPTHMLFIARHTHTRTHKKKKKKRRKECCLEMKFILLLLCIHYISWHLIVVLIFHEKMFYIYLPVSIKIGVGDLSLFYSCVFFHLVVDLIKLTIRNLCEF